MSNEETVFPKGLIVKRRENAPEFVVCDLSIKEDEFAEYIATNCNGNGWVNIDILISKAGNLYAKLNDFKPNTEGVGSTCKDSLQVEQEDDEFDELSADYSAVKF